MQLGDARKLDQKTQEALRHRAVHLVGTGATHMEAALAVGVHRGTVSRWCGTYRRDGASGLEKGKRGRRAGDRLMLTAAEARRLQRWIRDKMPDQMKLPFALWTAQAVRELILKKLGKTLGLSTMPLYLKRWGFTAQKPLTRAMPRDPRKIAARKFWASNRNSGSQGSCMKKMYQLRKSCAGWVRAYSPNTLGCGAFNIPRRLTRS
jgi:transposase